MGDAPHILIVEDDENLRLALEDNLDDEGYRVTAVDNGKDAIVALMKGGIELVVLDIMLPDTDGYSICRRIRKEGWPVRVLMLTARTLESDLVEGFDAGADDYLSKPYRLRELLARVKALLRRPVDTEPAPSSQFAFGGYRLDAEARVLHDESGEEVILTRTEFDLLACLLRHQGKALSREDILAQAWDPGIVVDPRTVDNFVSSLKKKLGWTKDASYRIKTVRGVGYRLEVDG
ncbi:MAG: response regulator transcription factor [Myxococcales bacterium]|nr:response regulator transcription factor [Myxococcales bacterium]